MVDFKVVISNKEGKSVQRELTDPNSRNLVGKKISDIINGESIGLAGFEFQITGGSDYCGFPMRKDVQGMGRKRIFAVAGVGIRKIGKGIKQRKTVCGNTIHPRISQVNLKVLKEGKEKLFEAVGQVKKGVKKEEKEVEKKKKEMAREKKGKAEEKEEFEKKEEAKKEEKVEVKGEEKKQ